MTSRSRGILALVALHLVGVGFAFPQAGVQPPLTFGSSVDVINLTVTVTDAQGRPVSGLDKEMFSVYEDGARQDLVLFNKDRLPLSLILLMDASASMDDKVAPAKAAAKRFVSTLVPSDRARIVAFNNRIEVLQDFTGDKAALNSGIDRLVPSGATALHNAFYISLKDLQKEKARAGAATRRPAIILLSDGENTASIVTEDQVIELARRAEIGIYSIRITTDYEGDKGRPETKPGSTSSGHAQRAPTVEVDPRSLS